MFFWHTIRAFLILVVFYVFTIPLTLFAQNIEDFGISVEPVFPKEFQNTILSIDSYSAQLQNSKIVWKENGTVVAQDFGLTERSFTAPRNGFSKTITIEVTTQSGIKLTRDYLLAPQAMDLLWEAVDSYVPPFYKGKAMAAEESLVRMVAIPNFTSNGSVLDRTQTIFNWTIGGRKQEQYSGYGKSSIVFKFSPIKNGETVKVLGETLSGNSQTEEVVSLRPFPTDIVFYEASPLLGTIYDRAFVKGVQILSDEITLVSEPYFYSGGTNNSNLVFTWNIDNVSVNPGVDKSRLTLRNPDTSGSAIVSVSVKHIEKTLQNISRSLQLIYEK